MKFAETNLGKSLSDDARARQFRKTLQRLRLGAQLSQEGVAEKLGVSRQTVSKWETGEAYPSTEHLLRLASVLGCSLSELAGEAAKNDSGRASDKNRSEAEKQGSVGTLTRALIAENEADSSGNPVQNKPNGRKSLFWRLGFATLALLMTVLCCGVLTINCLETDAGKNQVKLAVFDKLADGFLDSALTEIGPKIKKTVVGYGFSEETGEFYVKCRLDDQSEVANAGATTGASHNNAPCAVIVYFCDEDCLTPYSCEYLDDASYTPRGEFHAVS